MRPIMSQTEYELYKELFAETQKYCFMVTAERNRISRIIEDSAYSSEYVELLLKTLDMSLKFDYSRLEEMAKIIHDYEQR